MDKLVKGAEKLGLSLTPEQVVRFETYCREMLDWNKRINLTGIRDYEAVQVRHFLDALTIVPVLEDSASRGDFSVMDVGTGAGVPGLPLKFYLPEIRLTLLEATAKKTEFLRYVVSTFGLKRVDIVAARAEEAARQAEYRECYNAVLSRAVAPLATLVELTLPFCATGGLCVFPKKGDIAQELEESLPAIEMLGGVVKQVREIELEELPDRRCLVVIEKTSPTPEKYPRRTGIPEKRPLK
jgi:16S rRNA (guanine527-N7)-methyltransferase